MNKKFKMIFNNHLHRIHIIGSDDSKPIIVFIHGGPGYPNRHNIVKEHLSLTNNFNLVLYDERGSGGSYYKTKKEDMTLDILVEDLRQIISYSLNLFNQTKVNLLCGSFGTELGIIFASKYPELISNYVGFGQTVNGFTNEEVSYDYVYNLANLKEKKKLEKIGRPVKGCYNPILKGLSFERSLVSKYTDSNVNKTNSSTFKTLMSKEYSLKDKIGYVKGAYFSINNFWENVVKYDFSKDNTKFDVPVYFFLGRYDYVTPTILSQEYFKLIESPHKELIYFEHSAHNPFNQEKELFEKTLVNKLIGENK